MNRQPIPTPITLEDLEPLVTKLRLAKIAENQKRQDRIAVEDRIAALMPTEGTKQTSVKLPDGTKVTVRRGLLYKADAVGLTKLFGEEFAGAHVPLVYKTTTELDVPGYEWYRENQRAVFDRMLDHVTVKPKKISVTLENPRI